MTAFAWVAVLGFISGTASWFAFRRCTNGERLRQTANRIVAHLFEIRLFADEPAVVLRAQRDLIFENGRLLSQLAKPCLILLLPFTALLTVMELFFGRAPLPVGGVALLTVQFAGAPAPAHLEAPPGITVEEPPLFAKADRQLVWKLSAVHPLKDELRISTGNATILKSITAGDQCCSFLTPREWPFSSAGIDSIEIAYPPAAIFGLHWLWWFGLSSLLAAVVISLYQR